MEFRHSMGFYSIHPMIRNKIYYMEDGIGEFVDALYDRGLDPGVKSLMREALLPPLCEHIVDLKSLTA